MTSALPKTKRRWRQFSLRGLLMFVTVFCLLLGLHIHRVGKQQAAVKAIERIGGGYCHEWEREATNLGALLARWRGLRDLLGDDHFFHVTFVHVPIDSDVDVQVMPRLADLPRLRRLSLSGGAADEDLVHLRGLSHLEDLSLDGDLITDPGAAHLGGLRRLRKLYVYGSRVTDAGLSHLRNLRNLEGLCLSGADITDAGLAHLSKMHKLESLYLDGTRVTDAGLMHVEGLTNLKVLSLANTAVSAKGLTHLARLKNLQDLNLCGTAIGGGDLSPIADLPELADLNLQKTEITSAALAGLSTMTQLRRLYLDESAVTDAGLAQLSRLCHLKSLWLSDTAITDEGLRRLPVFRKLEALGLSGTRVTGAGLRQLEDHGVIQRVYLSNTKLSDWPQLLNTTVDGGGFTTGDAVFPASARFACFGGRLVADAVPSARELLGRLAYQDTATAVLATALAWAKPQRLLYDQHTDGERELAGAAFVRTPAGVGAAVMLGPRRTQGFANKEIIPPWDDFHFYDLLVGDRLIGFDASARPAWVATRQNQWSAMLIVDADGDGYVEELVRWNTDYERADRPFLVIHDLTRPGLPAMLAIELYEHKAPKRLRWSFRPGQRPYRDLVIEEKHDGRFRTVTVFPYRPDSRTWDLDAAQPRACWRRLDDPKIALHFESL